MKDIVKDALESAAQKEGSETVSSDKFGLPEYLYVAIGSRGIKRLSSELVPPGNQSGSGAEVETVITKVAFQSGSVRQPDDSDQIDQYVNEPQALTELDIEIDCCFITADVDKPSVISDILAVANSLQDSLVIALLTTSTDDHQDIARQFHDSLGITVVIREADSRFDMIESLSGSSSLSPDRLVQRLVKDFITLFVGPNLVAVDYARVLNQWDSGRKAVPFVGTFDQSEISDPDYSSSNSFVGPFNQSSTDWFGYAWIGPLFTMADFESFWDSLDRTLRSDTKDRCGILGCGVDEQLEGTVFVSGVQFIDCD